MRRVLAVAITVFLVGCDRFEAISMPIADKVSKAFPLPPNVAVAQASLLAELSNDPAQVTLVSEQMGKLMTIRALACAGTTQIGQFDRPEDLKAKLTDRECFKKQDAGIADWLGLRRLRALAAQPALRAYSDLPDKLVVQSGNGVAQLAVAESANVAVVQGQKGKFVVLDLSNGKQINSFNSASENYRHASISPNGRLVAVPISNYSLSIHEVESGSVIWTSDKHSQLVGWLAQLDAVLLNESSNGKTVLMQLQTGRTEPLQVADLTAQWALALDGVKNQQLLGGSNSVALVEYSQGADGALSSSLVKQWRLSGLSGSGSAPVSMLNGKLLAFVNSSDVGWLDLESGKHGSWELSMLGGYTYSKMDEKNLLYYQSGQGRGMFKVLDVQALTIADAASMGVDGGRRLSLAPRLGFAKLQNDAMVIQTKISFENPQALEPLLSAALLERQLRKLQAGAANSGTDAGAAALAAENAAINAARAAAQAAAGQTGAAASQNKAYIEALSRSVRAANAAAAIKDGLPRDVVERIGQGIHLNAGASPQTNAAARTGPPPLLADIPPDAKLEMVGVYQGAGPRSGGSGARVPAAVRVNVSPGKAPVVLALTSYEPVTWLVQNSSGRKISAVLLSGYHESSVLGAGSAKTLKIGSNYAFKLGSPEYERLKVEVAKYVSNPVASFQGNYEGREFTVGH